MILQANDRILAVLAKSTKPRLLSTNGKICPWNKGTAHLAKVQSLTETPLQLNFLIGPYFNHPSILSVNKVLDNINKKDATRQALTEINTSFSETFETSFTK